MESEESRIWRRKKRSTHICKLSKDSQIPMSKMRKNVWKIWWRGNRTSMETWRCCVFPMLCALSKTKNKMRGRNTCSNSTVGKAEQQIYVTFWKLCHAVDEINAGRKRTKTYEDKSYLNDGYPEILGKKSSERRWFKQSQSNLRRRNLI